MRKEQITNKEAICTLITFIIGSTLIIGIGGEAKNDAWIAGIIATLMFLPFILIYSRISSLFPGKDLFEILESSMGIILGKIISVIYILYAFHLGSLVLRNFGEFINTAAMPETPIIVPMLCLGIICVLIVKSGIEVIGRFCAYLFPIIFIIIVIVQLLAIPHLNIDYLRPVLADGFKPVLRASFSVFSFPFAETILFLGVFCSLKTKNTPYKVYFWGIISSSILIIAITLRNIAVLGPAISTLYFPSYVAVSRIHIGTFVERIEGTVALVLVMGAFIKSSICLLVASRGVACLFKLDDYRNIVLQIGLLMVYFSYIVYENIMQMREWAFDAYPYYAFPFQVILPILIWIMCEIKSRKLSNQKCK